MSCRCSWADGPAYEIARAHDRPGAQSENPAQILKRLTVVAALLCAVAAAGLFIPNVRQRVRALVRPEPPARITPLALAPTPLARPRPPLERRPTPTRSPIAARPSPSVARPSPTTAATPTDTPTPAPSPTPEPVVVNGRVYDAYIPAATKQQQAYQYSCEFDAAWVILQTYGFDAQVDELIAIVGVDKSVEPYIEQTRDGFVI